MLKCLFATCLTAFSVNTLPLSVSPSLEPSKAIIRDNVVVVDNSSTTLYEKVPKYSTNEVNTLDDLIFGNVYHFHWALDIDYGGFLTFNYLLSLPTLFDISFNLDDFLPDDSPSYFINISEMSLDDYYFYLNVSYGTLYTSLECIMSPTTIIDFDFVFDTYDTFTNVIVDYFSPCLNIPYEYRAIPSTHNSNLYRLLYDFYYGIFNDHDLSVISTGYNMPFDNWLAHTCTIATLITLIVVAFFFLRWLFKVISGLILLKR